MHDSISTRHRSKPELLNLEKPYHATKFKYEAKKSRPHYKINDQIQFPPKTERKDSEITQEDFMKDLTTETEFPILSSRNDKSYRTPRLETFEISSLYRQTTEASSPRSNMIPTIVTPRRIPLQKDSTKKDSSSYYLKPPPIKTNFVDSYMRQNTERNSMSNSSNPNILNNYLNYMHSNNGPQIGNRLFKLKPKEKLEEEDDFSLIKLPELLRMQEEREMNAPRLANILKLPSSDSVNPGLHRSDSRESTLSSLVFQRLASYYQGLRKVEKKDGGKKEMQWRNNYKEFFMELASNLHMLTKYMNKIHKITNIVKDMSSGSKKIIDLLAIKKLSDYDYEKLVKKFSVIEEIKVFFIPGVENPISLTKPSRNFQPSIKIEPQLMKELFFFNEQLEKHLIELKKHDLKYLEHEIIERENKLNDIHQQKLKNYHKNRDNGSFYRAEEILLDKPRIDPFRFLQNNPYDEIEAFQSGNGDARFIKKTTLETSRNVHEIFENWIGHISSTR